MKGKNVLNGANVNSLAGKCGCVHLYHGITKAHSDSGYNGHRIEEKEKI